MSIAGSNAWFESHGIDPKVGERRGVVRYDRGDTTVKEVFREFLAPTRLATITRKKFDPAEYVNDPERGIFWNPRSVAAGNPSRWSRDWDEYAVTNL